MMRRLAAKGNYIWGRTRLRLGAWLSSRTSCCSIRALQQQGGE